LGYAIKLRLSILLWKIEDNRWILKKGSGKRKR
jgi:hypothetical protein